MARTTQKHGPIRARPYSGRRQSPCVEIFMADVQVNSGGSQPAPAVVETSGGGGSAVWAILVIVLLAIVAWFLFGRGVIGGRGKDTNINANVKVETPATPAPSKAP